MRPNTQYKRLRGVYCIRNLRTGRTYVGQTACMWQRCRQHLDAIRTGDAAKGNRHLIDDVKLHGLDAFTLEPLQLVPFGDMREIELAWIRRLQTDKRDFGYNLRGDTADGMITHAETSKLLSARLKASHARGERSSHSTKLSQNWNGQPVSRRKQQADIMSRNLTRWQYIIGEETIDFPELKRRGLASVLSAFSRKKTNEATCHGVTIRRVPHG